jgi:hypothetical protein
MITAAEYLTARLRLRGMICTAVIAAGVAGSLLMLARCEGSGPHP